MRNGQRQITLCLIGHALDGWAAEDRPGVVACSALRRAYRDALRAGRPQARIVYVEIDEALARSRVAGRADHYYPAFRSGARCRR